MVAEAEETTLDTIAITGICSTLGGLIIRVLLMLHENAEETITMSHAMSQNILDA
jgi:hypothetical protein